RRRTSGTVRLDGKLLPAGSVPAAVTAGMGLAPEERKTQALFLEQTVTKNISAASLAKYSRLGFVNPRRETSDPRREIATLDVRPDNPRRAAKTLSGGNQQKVVVARWLLRDCKLLILDEPTRGVDVGARAEIYAVIRRLADSGVGVLVVSSEVPEVLGL